MVQKRGRKRPKNLVSPKKRVLSWCVQNSKTSSRREKVAIQSWLRPALRPVSGNCDFRRFERDLQRIEEALRACAVESLAVEYALENLGPQAGTRARRKRAAFAPVALRMELLRHLLGVRSFREFSVDLCRGERLADFCGILTIEGIKWSSKSTLERASKLFSPGQMAQMNRLLTEASANAEHCAGLGLNKPVDASVCLVDSTCLEANIHFPVDWVLLRDLALSLLKAIGLIRREGLRHRLPEGPEALARQMNRLCIEMTHARRQSGAKKRRKAVLRQMKALLRRIARHAARHDALLLTNWPLTRWSEREAERVRGRIAEKLALLPAAIEQAHERIIGERAVPNAKKILSAHERDLHVIVRGKAGKEVEFGNGLFICESPEGFILDYHLYRGQPPAETVKLRESLARQQSWDIDAAVTAVVGDRGFDSRGTDRELSGEGIANFICPKSVHGLRERMKEETFRHWQKRRAGTEARIAILKHQGRGRVCRAKGYDHRALAVGWGVLAHNLWWIARKVRENEEAPARAA